MPKFGAASIAQLTTCDKRLQEVMNLAIQWFDFAVLEGHRGKEKQNAAFQKGFSQKQWPNGEHNSLPSKACDIAPWPLDWSDRAAAIERFVYLAGFVMAAAKVKGIKLRWGGDWNRNQDTRDEHFRDYGHFEVDE